MDINMTVVGRLTADPELRFTASGQAVVNFTVASTPRRFDQKTREWTDGEPVFMRCVAWRELAENTAESLRRGDEVVVVGKAQIRKWETKAGEKRSEVEVKAEFVGPSLRYATCSVHKAARRAARPGPSDNEW